MKVTSQTLENRRVALTVQVEDERVQEELRRAAKRVAGRINIPGFRKGKAPYQVVLRIVGEDALYREVISEISEPIFREALEECRLDPYGPAEIDNIQHKPLVFKATVSLRPIVELGEYRALRVPFTPPQITDEMVENVLKGLQQRNATLEPAGEGPVGWNQIAVLTIDGRLGQDESAPVIIHEHDIHLSVAETTDFPFPGFIQQIVGMRVGEEKSFELPVPEDNEDERLRGQTIYFKVQLQDLKVRTIPPLDDALAQTIGEYETLDALRGSVRASLLQQAMRDAEAQYADACLQQLAKQAHIEFPPQMVEKELDSLVKRAEDRLRSQKMNLDEFLNIKKQTRQEYRQELRPRAENGVRQALALTTLVESERVSVSEDEVDDYTQGLLRRYGKSDNVEAELSSDESRRSIAFDLLTSKGIERLISICKGENPPLPAADEPTLATDTPSIEPEPAATVADEPKN